MAVVPLPLGGNVLPLVVLLYGRGCWVGRGEGGWLGVLVLIDTSSAAAPAVGRVTATSGILGLHALVLLSSGRRAWRDTLKV